MLRPTWREAAGAGLGLGQGEVGEVTEVDGTQVLQSGEPNPRSSGAVPRVELRGLRGRGRAGLRLCFAQG